MCGIAGIFGPNGDDYSTVHKMARIIGHRGPNGTAAWSEQFKTGGVSFGHTRLSIVDIEGSNQPLFSDNGCVLIFNGEIYNHREIRKVNSTYNFRTNGDGEAILAAYANRSDDIGWVRDLDGVWAFALWDPQLERLILSRDRFGVKPLLRNCTEKGNLLFGSEAKCLRLHPEYSPELDIRALIGRIAFEYSLDDTTLFEGVHSISPGTIETWDISNGKAKLQNRSIWASDFPIPYGKWSPKTHAGALLESLTSAVADRLMSDVPLGIILSGGLDSALIAAISNEASQRTGYPLPACWTVAESEDNPDWVAAESVCQSLELQHHQHLISENAFENSLPKLGWHGEDLDVTVLFFQPLFEKMSQSVKVGLCGQGADELHAGYPRYKNLRSHCELISKRLDACKHPFSDQILSENFISPGWRQGHNPDLVFADLGSTLNYELNNGQLTNFQLRLVDRHSMAHGLEVRVPFLGETHVTASSQIPVAWKLSSGSEKLGLREAARLTKLPIDIVNRPKLPAGRATSPALIDNLLDELKGHAQEYSNDIPMISKMFNGQPEISIGLRLFRSLHLTDGGVGRECKDLLTLLEDVD